MPGLQDLFLQFLSLPETAVFLGAAIGELSAGKSSPATSPSASAEAKGCSTPEPRRKRASDHLRVAVTRSPTRNIPKSPKKSPGRRSAGRAGADGKNSRGSLIKRFYFPNGAPISPTTHKRESVTMEKLFNGRVQGLTREEFFPVTTGFCGLSSYCNSALFDAVDAKSTGRVTLAMFGPFYTENLQKFDTPGRLFRILKRKGRGVRQYLTRDSFDPIILEVMRRHPGLEFLKSHPEFQGRYLQTVKARIFYKVNKSANEQLTARELKRSNLCQILALLDQEDDINRINDYFSYEHFYVIYCKFWELDEDHDYEIGAEDLMRYDDFSLTSRVVERVMEGRGRPFVAEQSGRMGYEDFVVFLMSEVDKSSDISVDYWFRCLDLDGDGVIAAYELEYFFEEQATRIQQLSQEDVLFTDVLCQLNDMIKPRVESQFTKADIKRSKMAPAFFDLLFNLSRHVQAEQRDPMLIQQIHNTPELSHWDRYAISEYIKLSDYEEGEGGAVTDDEQAGDEELQWDGGEMSMDVQEPANASGFSF